MIKITIAEMNEEIERLDCEILRLKNEIETMRKLNTELRHMAEKTGSEMAKWKHRAIRAEEKISK